MSDVQAQRYVVDASVGIQLFITGSLSDAAHALFARLSTEPPIHLYVPDLFYIEIANVLWKYVRGQGLPVTQAQYYLHQLGRLALCTASTSNLMVDALAHAATYNITAYDACYLALAQQMTVPLVTADAKFANHINDSKRVHLLG